MYASHPTLETRSKIVATLGPASWAPAKLRELILAGVDVCRINCSHADHASIRRQVAGVRSAASELQRHVAVLLDLQGPKIRTGAVSQPLSLVPGDVLVIVMDPDHIATDTTVGTTYPEMADDVTVGTRVLFADGDLSGEVIAIRADRHPAQVHVEMRHGGKLGSHKGINLPGVAMSVPSLTEKDKADLAVGVEAGVDYVALSFVRSAEDVLALKRALTALGRPTLPIVAKIEKPEAVEAIDAILVEADAVMVARGDLGVEVDLQQVPVYQKRIIAAARRHGKQCITATQMLDSMEHAPRPTRAETTDVANAILDGTDATMLSGETAIGDYPLEAVRTMDQIARAVEDSEFFRPTSLGDLAQGSLRVLLKAVVAAMSEAPRPLVVFTHSGATAIQVSKTRPLSPIFAITPNQAVADRLSLCWGVTPIVVPRQGDTDAIIDEGIATLRGRGYLRAGEQVLVLAGRRLERGANLLLVHQVPPG